MTDTPSPSPTPSTPATSSASTAIPTTPTLDQVVEALHAAKLFPGGVADYYASGFATLAVTRLRERGDRHGAILAARVAAAAELAFRRSRGPWSEFTRLLEAYVRHLDWISFRPSVVMDRRTGRYEWGPPEPWPLPS